MAAAALPSSLKAINSYIKLAKDYDKKDPVVAYFCKFSSLLIEMKSFYFTETNIYQTRGSYKRIYKV